MIVVALLHVLLVSVGAVGCAVYVRQHRGAGVAAVGFAIQSVQLAYVWMMLHAQGWLPMSWGIVFAAWLFQPWLGGIAILLILVGVSALLMHDRTRESYRWAGVGAAGTAMQVALVLGSVVASRDYRYANPLGDPFAVLAWTLPLLHLAAQCAILMAALGVIWTSRRTSGCS